MIVWTGCGYSDLKLWLLACRPQTLTMTLVPVAVGTAVAWNETGQVHWLATVVALLGGVLIQAATNLYNDAADFERGNDAGDRLGPPRMVATGVFTAAQVKQMAARLFILAALTGFYLIFVGGWPILILGLLSIISGYGYTGGPKPIAYTPLGELFVMAFFGIGAVCGTYWLACSKISVSSIVAGVAVGAFASAVLLVNNHRDAVSDARVGRRTLSIVLGFRGAQWAYVGLMVLPFVALAVLSALLADVWVLAAFLVAPLSVRVCLRFLREPRGRGLNLSLVETAQAQLVYGTALCVGLIG